MKKQTIYLILTAFFMAQLGFAASISEYAVIKGTIPSATKKVKEVTILSVDEGKAVVAATSVLNDQKEFGFMLPITKPGFYYVDYGQFKSRRQLIRLYLEPKQDINIVINPANYVLSGKNIGQNVLVQKANEIYDEFAVFSNMTKNTTYLDFYPFIDGGVAKAEAFKKTINTKDAEFNKMLKLAVDTDVEELTYYFFRMPRTKFPEKGNYPEIIKKWRADKKFTNPDILKLANGASLMSLYFVDEVLKGDTKPARLEFIPQAVTHITDPQLQDVYVRDAIENAKYKIEEYEKLAPVVKPYLISEKSKDYILEYEKVLHKSVGQKGVDFTYNDVDNKPVSFADFKGKFVYIDLWATWCGPCKKEIPYMKKIEEDYHGKNIVFVSISLDKEKDLQKWKDFVKTEQLKGVQLMADKDFNSDIAKNYEVTGIPRFLLFDEKGNIINADAFRPSDPELRVQLDKLLKV